MRWADLPERYEKCKSLHKRFVSWAEADVWDRLFDNLVADQKNPYLMLDATIVQAHQQAATGRKKGAKTSSGRFRGGPSTKIHLLAIGLGEPVAFRLTGGQSSESTEALPLPTGGSAEIVTADRGYDSNTTVDAIQAMGAVPVIPSKIGDLRLRVDSRCRLEAQ